jgi:hypothetical protein
VSGDGSASPDELFIPGLQSVAGMHALGVDGTRHDGSEPAMKFKFEAERLFQG